MLWHDFFYFSKGERTGLIILLSIVAVAVTLLFLNRQPPESVEEQSIVEAPSVSRNPAAASTPKDTAVATNNTSDAGLATTSPKATSSKSVKEPVAERVNRLTSYSKPTYTRVEKYAEGTVVELNTADTTTLKKVPGIGSAFANRIVNYRRILGGYYSVTQLSEVYGIDEERYIELQPWFTVDPSYIIKLEVNTIAQDTLRRHPYINYAQAKVIIQLRRQKGKLTGWENLQLLNEFTESDKIRLQPYLSFE